MKSVWVMQIHLPVSITHSYRNYQYNSWGHMRQTINRMQHRFIDVSEFDKYNATVYNLTKPFEGISCSILNSTNVSVLS